MPTEWVTIQHPKLKAPPARVTRKAFEQVHKAKGFELVKAEKEGDK